MCTPSLTACCRAVKFVSRSHTTLCLTWFRGDIMGHPGRLLGCKNGSLSIIQIKWVLFISKPGLYSEGNLEVWGQLLRSFGNPALDSQPSPEAWSVTVMSRDVLVGGLKRLGWQHRDIGEIAVLTIRIKSVHDIVWRVSAQSPVCVPYRCPAHRLRLMGYCK